MRAGPRVPVRSAVVAAERTPTSGTRDRAARPRTERGETLVELLVSIMIMGVALVVLLGGVGTAIRMSSLHRHRVAANAYARAFATAIEDAVAASPTGYLDCAGPASYAGAYTLSDPGYTGSIASVRYWAGSAFGTTCSAGSDTGVQEVTVRVQSTDGMVDQQLKLIIRRPCRSTTDFPLDPPCS
jgi:type II secretory pathway pseudopilin PulG